ncbi:MAG: ABC transporter permease, partial [Cyanobacteria bacterium J06626_6]
MTTAASTTASNKTLPPEAQPVQRSAWTQFRRDRMAILGSLILIIIILAVIFGPLFYTASFSNIDFARALAKPSLLHPFGTNDRGQDQLARVLIGGRVSIAVAITAMLVSISF